MPTRDQVITIQTAKRWLMQHRGFTDQAYRTVLWNVAGVTSSTDDALGHAAFERVMAVLEAHGFDGHPGGPRYWRTKAARDGDRAAWKIEAMCAEYGVASAGFVLRMTNGRTDRVDQLDGQEMWVIIEALKKMLDREPKHDELHVPGRSDDRPAAEEDAVRSGPPAGRQMRGLFEDGDGAGDRSQRREIRGHAAASAFELPEVTDDVPF